MTPKSSLTSEQLALFLAVEDVLQRYGFAFDDMCSIYAEVFEDDSEAAEDEQVKSLLHEAAVSLRHAGMDWYVSTK